MDGPLIGNLAAICPAASRFEMLAAVAGLDEMALIGHLRSLVGRGLLVVAM